MTYLRRSWVSSANTTSCPFPLNNLPCGVFSTPDQRAHCGVAIGDHILDVTALEAAGILDFGGAFSAPTWNAFMASGAKIWAQLREQLTDMLAEGSAAQPQLAPFLVHQHAARLHMPFTVAEFTDFYAGRHHATNVGAMFRGPEHALPANWLHMPIGYNGRASSVVVSGTKVRRPWGQVKAPDESQPRFAPSARFDFELEVGAVVGSPSERPLTVEEADAHIFGYVLLNDWSARDIQAWEYQPLGPFKSKSTATTIGPWIVMKAALEPFRCAPPKRDVALLAHLQDPAPLSYDIELTAMLAPAGKRASQITSTNYRELYYTAAQQLAHHSSSGCPMRVGDLIGSGTISGATEESRGSLLELSWGGQAPITLHTGEQRGFLHDGDTVTLNGAARAESYTIGFGDCAGSLLPALKKPFKEI
ncbi:MAG: fumarylacetoacetase [Pseudomonadota bacterium]